MNNLSPGSCNQVSHIIKKVLEIASGPVCFGDSVPQKWLRMANGSEQPSQEICCAAAAALSDTMRGSGLEEAF